MLRFGDYRLDPADQRLWRGETVLPLAPRAFAVLAFLVARAGRLVTKEELLSGVWPGTHVGDAVLKTSILEIRKVLRDDPREPRYVETLHRRGYRFLVHPTAADAAPAPAGLCGRNDVLAQLDALLERAAAGRRQVVFVTGDAGIGKTTVVETFLQRLAVDPNVRIARGQCLEVFGAGEPYRPVLEALGELCRAADGGALIELLERHAPTWLVQLPAVLDVERRSALLRLVHGVTGDRMPREMASLLETLTADGPTFVLVLEDLHWSDAATLDLLSMLARRRKAARLMVLATYRPIDAAMRGHPLRIVHDELAVHRLAHEIALELLGEDDVRQMIGRLVPGAASAELARMLHARTDGLPLFVAAVIAELVAEQHLVRTGDTWQLATPLAAVAVGLPDGVRRMIERQIDHVEADDRELLATASVAGDAFSSDTVARVLERAPSDCERRCTELAARGVFLSGAGLEDTPDGATSARFAFRHALYRRVLQDGIPPARRAWIARRLGELTEERWGARAAEIAGELAAHFTDGRDWRRAVRYRRLAAEQAVARWAYDEALLHLDAADALLRHVEPAARDGEALAIEMARGPALVAARGYAAPEAQRAFARAYELCGRVPESPLLVPALWGLCAFYSVSGELRRAQELAAQLEVVAERTTDDGLRLEAHHVGWVTSFFAGELARAAKHFAAGRPLYDVQRHADHVLLYGQDAGVSGHAYFGAMTAVQGRLDDGLRATHEGRELADRIGHPLSRVFARLFVAWACVLRDEPGPQLVAADETLALSDEYGFPFWAAGATILRGHALARRREKGGIASMERGIAALRATGTLLAVPAYLTLLAEEYAARRRLDDAERTLAEAETLAEASGQGWWRAETLRVRADVAGRHGDARRAEATLRAALDVARAQGAGTFELRSAVALARSLRERRRLADARQLLTAAMRRVRGEGELPLLVAARALRAELAAPARRA